MRIEQLEYLVEIAKTNSISIAAENLYVSQPAISEAIKKLECELDVTLLIRTKTGSYLTPIGKVVAGQAVHVLAETQKIKQLIDEYHHNTQPELNGELRIYTAPSVSNQILPQALADFRSQNPNVTFSVFDEHAIKTIDAIASGNGDLGIITMHSSPEIPSGLTLELLAVARAYLKVSSQSPLAAKKSISPKEITQIPLAVLMYNEQESYPQKELFAGMQLNIVLRTSNNNLIRQQVNANKLATIVLNSSLSDKTDAVSFIPIRDNSKLKIYGLYVADAKYSNIIKLFLSTLKQYF